MTETRELKRIWTTGKSNVVALPKDWVGNLTSDNVIFSSYKDGFFIRPVDNKKLPLQNIEVLENEDPNVLKYKIISAYLKNYQEVRVSFKSEEPNPVSVTNLYSMSRSLTGLDVSPTSKNEFFVTMSTTPKPLKSILERMLSQSKAIHTINQNLFEHFDLIPESEEKGPTGPIEIENDIDKHNALVRRLLCRAISQPDLVRELEIEDLTDVIHWESINSNLERVGDMEFECYLEIKHLIETLGKDLGKDELIIRTNDKKTGFSFKEYHDIAIQMVEDAYEGRKEGTSQKIFKLLNTKQPKKNLDLIKTRKGYVNEEKCKALNGLIKATPELGRVDIRIWSITSCATNLAEAWLNIKGPIEKPPEEKPGENQV